jgi:hypothetical protein
MIGRINGYNFETRYPRGYSGQVLLKIGPVVF